MDEIAKARDIERQASIAQREGRFADAERLLGEAIAIWTRLRGPDDVEVLNDQMNLAVAYRRWGEAARAVPLLERVAASSSWRRSSLPRRSPLVRSPPRCARRSREDGVGIAPSRCSFLDHAS